jgi:hypothetical protein
VATTGEELGLLGAQAFAENPPLPLDRIVAAFNVDSTGLVPPGGPVAIVGRGMTGIDGEVARVLAGMRRRLVPEGEDAEGTGPNAPNAYVRRQDSWALIQHDVPAMMVSNSYADPVRLGAFMAGAYHTPADTPDKVDYAGLADDVRINAELVRDFADLRRYPGHAGRDGGVGQLAAEEVEDLEGSAAGDGVAGEGAERVGLVAGRAVAGVRAEGAGAGLGGGAAVAGDGDAFEAGDVAGGAEGEAERVGHDAERAGADLRVSEASAAGDVLVDCGRVDGDAGGDVVERGGGHRSWGGM